MDAHLRYFKQVHPCHYFHIDISRSCTHVIQTFSVAFSLGIWTTTSDGTVYQSSNSLTHHISYWMAITFVLLFYNGFVNYNASQITLGYLILQLQTYPHPSFSIFWTWQRLLTLPFQVLAFAQQSRERSNYEQAALLERMQEFKRQIDRESRWSPNGMNDSPNGDGIQTIGRSSHKMIEEAMQSASKGKVTRYWNFFSFSPLNYAGELHVISLR